MIRCKKNTHRAKLNEFACNVKNQVFNCWCACDFQFECVTQYEKFIHIELMKSFRWTYSIIKVRKYHSCHWSFMFSIIVCLSFHSLMFYVLCEDIFSPTVHREEIRIKRERMIITNEKPLSKGIQSIHSKQISIWQLKQSDAAATTHFPKIYYQILNHHIVI